MTDPVVQIQVDKTNSQSTTPWFGEVAVVTHALQRHGSLKVIQSRRHEQGLIGKGDLRQFEGGEVEVRVKGVGDDDLARGSGGVGLVFETDLVGEGIS